jgi:putative transposase
MRQKAGSSMRKTRFTDEQIATVLAEARAGMSTQEICRKHSISAHTFYAWRKKFGSLERTEVRRLKDLEQMVTRLERIVARQAVELQAAQEVIRGKW